MKLKSTVLPDKPNSFVSLVVLRFHFIITINLKLLKNIFFPGWIFETNFV